jgi:hypothetical protein
MPNIEGYLIRQCGKRLSLAVSKRNLMARLIERLQALSNDHFNAHPDEVNWGHVGDLGHYAELLKQITDSAFNEGEHAE